MRVPRRSGTVGTDWFVWLRRSSRGSNQEHQLRPLRRPVVGIIYGKQVKDRDGQAAAEVLNPSSAALHAVRTTEGGLP